MSREAQPNAEAQCKGVGVQGLACKGWRARVGVQGLACGRGAELERQDAQDMYAYAERPCMHMQSVESRARGGRRHRTCMHMHSGRQGLVGRAEQAYAYAERAYAYAELSGGCGFQSLPRCSG